MWECDWETTIAANGKIIIRQCLYHCLLLMLVFLSHYLPSSRRYWDATCVWKRPKHHAGYPMHIVPQHSVVSCDVVLCSVCVCMHALARKLHTKYICATVSFYYIIIYKICVRFVRHIAMLIAVCYLLVGSYCNCCCCCSWRLWLLFLLTFCLSIVLRLTFSLVNQNVQFHACHQALVYFTNSRVYIQQQPIHVGEQGNAASFFCYWW